MARNFATKEGAKVQEYCMYFKLLQRAFGGKVPPAAAGAFNQCFLMEGLIKYVCGAITAFPLLHRFSLYTVLLLQQFQEDLPGGLGK
ncbi:MAG: hypothetical protein LUD69_03395 [Oscillospiraceae bacterium]|nr:hypothetical protein [Oscillospiraceae bacterium]